MIVEPLNSDSLIYGPADQLSVTVAGVSSEIGIVTIASFEAVLYESLTCILYWYSFTKSEFINTPFLLVTTPLVLHWNGFSCGSVNCDVPPYEPLATLPLSNSNLWSAKLKNSIVSPSLSVADIVPTVAPFELFSFIDERV